MHSIELLHLLLRSPVTVTEIQIDVVMQQHVMKSELYILVSKAL
jgi:hypothetical protein